MTEASGAEGLAWCRPVSKSPDRPEEKRKNNNADADTWFSHTPACNQKSKYNLIYKR